MSSNQFLLNGLQAVSV